MNKLSKFARFKINTQKSAAFNTLTINNSKRKLRKQFNFQLYTKNKC